MAKFFVGQRVRIASCNCWWDLEAMSLVGKEAVVNGLDVMNECDESGNIGVTVDGDDNWVFLPQELEPILDRHEPCEAEFKESLDELLSRENNNETVK